MGTQSDRRQLARAVIASTIGTTIEWYDFFLYSAVTGLVLARLYFPQSEPLVGTLQAFGPEPLGAVRGSTAAWPCPVLIYRPLCYQSLAESDLF
jgi:hypothetical protein